MNREIEEKFINNFIVKDKRERIRFELSSAKKRETVIQRIYNLLDRKFAVLEDPKVSDEELKSVLKKYFNPNKECYIISESDDDGRVMPFKQAFENMIDFEVNYLIICDENTVLMSEEYTTFGSPNRIILHKNSKN
ncbi:MAG: hypothetical protein K2L12_05900 [Clostridia bacterium]|nr:hypothetical protein [Clostridia bacterium]